MVTTKEQFDNFALIWWDTMDDKDKKVLTENGDDFQRWKLSYEKDVVQQNINKLIAALYIPKGDNFVKDPERLKKFNVDEDEPINWGDLKCIEVLATERGFQAIVEEAAPGDCQTFCEYIEKYMGNLGWSVEIKTEW